MLHFHDPATGVQLEIVNRETLVEYLAENYKDFGATLEFITDRSQEGSQFCRGFGGIGGTLRWKIDFQDLEVVEEYVVETTMMILEMHSFRCRCRTVVCYSK